MKKKMGFNSVGNVFDSVDTKQAKIIHYGWVKAKKDLHEDGGVFIPKGTIGRVLSYVPYTIDPGIYHLCIEWQKSVVKVPSYDEFGVTVWKEFHSCSQGHRLYDGTYDEYKKKYTEMRATGLIASYSAHDLIPLKRVR